MGAPAAYPSPGSLLAFHYHSHGAPRGVSCETSGDCTPYLEDGVVFTNAEDGGFGILATRITQPFDFAGREGRIHFEATLNGHSRMVLSVQISPRPIESSPDLRDTADVLDNAARDIDGEERDVDLGDWLADELEDL